MRSHWPITNNSAMQHRRGWKLSDWLMWLPERSFFKSWELSLVELPFSPNVLCRAYRHRFSPNLDSSRLFWPLSYWSLIDRPQHGSMEIAIGPAATTIAIVQLVGALLQAWLESFTNLVFFVHCYGVVGGIVWVFGSTEIWKIQNQVLHSKEEKVAMDFKASMQNESNMIAVAVCQYSSTGLWIAFQGLTSHFREQSSPRSPSPHFL